MREHKIPLFSLESKRPLKDFNIIGFSMGYELGYTNVLNMLDLAGIPVLASERDDSHPLIIAGGSCTLNPEPMADFIDTFIIGDGEDLVWRIGQGCRHILLPYGQRRFCSRFSFSQAFMFVLSDPNAGNNRR